MTIKEQVLLALEENKGTPLSGQELANKIGCTRTSIWKAVKELTDSGYQVDAVNKKGYTLRTSGDVISGAYISGILKAAGTDIKLEAVHSVDSTNNVLKQYAGAGIKDDMVLIAEEQTAGRGRVGRAFLSPEGTGIYMSFLLHPSASFTEASRLTTLAATAEAKAIEKVTGFPVDIKWVNDVWMRGKKVSGILTEASASIEDGSLEYVIVGIGFNVYEPKGGFAPEIRNIAGSIIEKNQSNPNQAVEIENLKNNIVAEFIIEFMNYYRDFPKNNFLEEYKKRCFVIGHDVEIMGADHKNLVGDAGGKDRSHAKVLDIDEECHLIVRYPDGEMGTLSSGEISVKI